MHQSLPLQQNTQASGRGIRCCQCGCQSMRPLHSSSRGRRCCAGVWQKKCSATYDRSGTRVAVPAFAPAFMSVSAPAFPPALAAPHLGTVQPASLLSACCNLGTPGKSGEMPDRSMSTPAQPGRVSDAGLNLLTSHAWPTCIVHHIRPGSTADTCFARSTSAIIDEYGAREITPRVRRELSLAAAPHAGVADISTPRANTQHTLRHAAAPKRGLFGPQHGHDPGGRRCSGAAC